VTTTEPTTTPTLGARVRRIALPVVLAVIGIAGSFGAADGQTDRREGDWFMVLLLLIGSLSLYWLRSHPIPVLWATVGSTLVYMLMQYPYGPVIFPFVIAAFTVIRFGHRLAGWVGIAALYVGHVGGRLVLGINEDGLPGPARRHVLRRPGIHRRTVPGAAGAGHSGGPDTPRGRTTEGG
jgi:hypothetical protein